MSKKKQVEKNIALSQKFTDYIVDNSLINNTFFPSGGTIVLYSFHDQQLNQMNEKLIVSLLEEGKDVLKVQETDDKENPWKFIPLIA